MKKNLHHSLSFSLQGTIANTKKILQKVFMHTPLIINGAQNTEMQKLQESAIRHIKLFMMGVKIRFHNHSSSDTFFLKAPLKANSQNPVLMMPGLFFNSGFVAQSAKISGQIRIRTILRPVVKSATFEITANPFTRRTLIFNQLIMYYELE